MVIRQILVAGSFDGVLSVGALPQARAGMIAR